MINSIYRILLNVVYKRFQKWTFIAGLELYTRRAKSTHRRLKNYHKILSLNLHCINKINGLQNSFD